MVVVLLFLYVHGSEVISDEEAAPFARAGRHAGRLARGFKRVRPRFVRQERVEHTPRAEQARKWASPPAAPPAPLPPKTNFVQEALNKVTKIETKVGKFETVAKEVVSKIETAGKEAKELLALQEKVATLAKAALVGAHGALAGWHLHKHTFGAAAADGSDLARRQQEIGQFVQKHAKAQPHAAVQGDLTDPAVAAQALVMAAESPESAARLYGAVVELRAAKLEEIAALQKQIAAANGLTVWLTNAQGTSV